MYTVCALEDSYSILTGGFELKALGVLLQKAINAMKKNPYIGHHDDTIWMKKQGLKSVSSEQGTSNFFCSRYFYCIFYTNINYGQNIQPLFWLKSQILVDWKGLFSQTLPTQTRNLQHLLTKFEENLYKFLRIFKREIVTIFVFIHRVHKIHDFQLITQFYQRHRLTMFSL